MAKNFNNKFDHDNDIQYNGYLLYKNKLINARTYEVLIANEIKILLPINFDMNRKNRILQNKKDFSEYKLNFKEYRYVDGFDSFLAINKAYTECQTIYKITPDYINAALTVFCFQVFSKSDFLDVLDQCGFKKSTRLFTFFIKNGFFLRIDDLPKGVNRIKRVYSFSEKGFSMVKLFYETLEKATVFDFKFKTKRELLVDSILKKYE
jgi:hypothetical protein